MVNKQSEFDKFMAESPIEVHEDPLMWWKSSERRFPVLSQLAKTYLAYPASSAPVERTFSKSSYVQSLKRCRLSEETLELQVMSSQDKDFIRDCKRRKLQ